MDYYIEAAIRFFSDVYQALCGRRQIILFIFLGIIGGLSVLLVRISNAVSYLSDAPETCMNCHVMTDAYASWQRGSHGRVSVCNDCHVPHDNIVAKTAFKGRDGMRHSAVFTLRTEPQVLRLSKGAVPVVQANCVRCHGKQLAMIRLAGVSERPCWDCHTNIHGQARSLSSSPQTLRPMLPDAGLHKKKKGSEHDQSAE